eukprot:2887106-Amphidinium_carterae.1
MPSSGRSHEPTGPIQPIGSRSDRRPVSPAVRQERMETSLTSQNDFTKCCSTHIQSRFQHANATKLCPKRSPKTQK